MILPVVCFVLGAAASLLAIRYFTHMFQLNAYKPKVQLKWLWHNSPRLWGADTAAGFGGLRLASASERNGTGNRICPGRLEYAPPQGQKAAGLYPSG